MDLENRQRNMDIIMKDVDCILHPFKKNEDLRCVSLIEHLGLEGYGIFWVLVETLSAQKDCRYPLNVVPALARKYNTSAEKMKSVIFSYGLFEIENDKFFLSDCSNKDKINKVKREVIKSKLISDGSLTEMTELPQNDDFENLVNMKEATKLFKSSPPTIRKYAKLGYYKEYRFLGKLVYYDRREILAFILNKNFKK